MDLFEDKRAQYGLNNRVKTFVLEVFDFCDDFSDVDPVARNIKNQLCRSASSIGANLRAAWRARSDREYLAKLGIVEEESDETCFWLDLMKSREKWLIMHERAEELYKEANQLTAITVSLIKRKKEKT